MIVLRKRGHARTTSLLLLVTFIDEIHVRMQGPEPSWGFFFQILRFLFGWMPLAMAVVPAVGITATVTLVVLLRLAVVLATSLRRKEFTGALAGRLRPHLKHAQAQVEVEAMHAAAAAAAVSSSSTPSLKTAAAAQVEVERAAMKVAQSRVELWVTSKICLYFLTPSARHFSTNSGSAILVHCFGLIVANAALLSYLNGTTPTSLAISGDGDSNGAIVFCIVCILFPLVLMAVFTAPYAAWIRSVLQLQAQRWTIRYKRRVRGCCRHTIYVPRPYDHIYAYFAHVHVQIYVYT